MTRSFLAAMAALLAVSGAQAADMATKAPVAAALAVPVANWQGLYVDVYFQYGMNLGTTPVSVSGLAGLATDLSENPRGPGLGGSVGYNIDNGAFVLGLRADISYMDLSASGQTFAQEIAIANATNYLGNIDILLGIPLGPDRKALIYGVGGLGFGGAHPQLSALGTTAAISDTSIGWNVGAGLRYQLNPNWQLFIEGDYYKLGSKQLNIDDPVTGIPVLSSSNQYNIVAQKAGFSYKF